MNALTRVKLTFDIVALPLLLSFNCYYSTSQAIKANSSGPSRFKCRFKVGAHISEKKNFKLHLSLHYEFLVVKM